MKKILRTKLQYNCDKREDFDYAEREYKIIYDRSFDMLVSASTKEDCEKAMESFEDAIAEAGIQNSFDSNLTPEYDEKKKIWVGAVEVYVGNNYVAEEKEAIKEVYNEWKKLLKTNPVTVETPATVETTEAMEVVEVPATIEKNNSVKSKVQKKHKGMKKIGGAIYIHRSNVDVLTQEQLELVWERLEQLAKTDFPCNSYEVIKIKGDTVSFIECEGWDELREPIVGNAYNVKPDGSVKLTKKREKNPQIYHHKWKFVAEDYTGFDVEKEKAWSEKWQSVVPKGLSSSLGSTDNWKKFLSDFKLD